MESTASQDDEGTSNRVAAIDLGTTYCSLAFTMKGKVETIILNPNQERRIPTAILLKKEGNNSISISGIGFVAQHMYETLPSSQCANHLYFECFKMQLRDEEKISREMKVSAFAQETYYLNEVISLLLQQLRIEFEEYLVCRKGLKAVDFKWVITVPTKWKNHGKNFMREAAYRAGLLSTDVLPITTLTPVDQPLKQPDMRHCANNLTLALEPECAALYCQQMTSDMLADYCGPVHDVTSKCYMVLDIGGGTTDIAIHKVEDTIKSVIPPTGNEWGGTRVNHEFLQLLQVIVRDPQFERFCTKRNYEAVHKAIISKLAYRDFELGKTNFGNATNSIANYNIRLNHKFVSFYGEDFIKAGVQALNDDKVKFEDGILIISFSKMEELFAPLVRGIFDCISYAITQTPVNTVYLVGGFGGCQYLYRRLREFSGENLPCIKNIIVPRDHCLAACIGAVIFQNYLRNYVKHLINDAQEKDWELSQSQKTVRTYQQMIQSQKEDWVITREEVTVTEKILGKGSYGQVNVGIFRGLPVAVKSLHNLIISDYNLALFTREMAIASRVRHPNLVLFIGATKVDSPLIVTELMSTSLYNELQKKALTRPRIVSIGQDVALGLNCLHLWKPNPIIHRDISSPNILLEPSVSAGFKAKIGDYGTANLQQDSRTKMPGNPAYAAPESLNPSDHSPSMDVYSYCVLLMEMSLHQPPAMSVEEREQQAVSLSWYAMKHLVQSGLIIDHRARPKMAQILQQIETITIM